LPDLDAIRLDDGVRIGAAVTTIDASTLGRARDIFAAHHALLLPHAFEPRLLDTLMSLASATTFEPDRYERIGSRVREVDDRVGQALRFALSRAALLDWTTAMAQCEKLTDVSGKLTEMRPATGHAIGWHDDRNEPNRRLALIVHLSAAPFTGGRFELARKRDDCPILAFGYLPPGSVLLFRVDAALRHRVTAVEGDRARRVFAGWIGI
jgi:hypothetical protein